MRGLPIGFAIPLLLAGGTTFGQTYLESVDIPSDGATVSTVNTLTGGWLYDVIVSGVFRYDVGEPGEFSDAQYTEDDNDQWTLRINRVEFDGVALNADILDLPTHTYTYHWVGTGSDLDFRIWDEPAPEAYYDNEGSLLADVYFIATPEPSTFALLGMAGLGLLWYRRRYSARES